MTPEEREFWERATVLTERFHATFMRWADDFEGRLTRLVERHAEICEIIRRARDSGEPGGV